MLCDLSYGCFESVSVCLSANADRNVHGNRFSGLWFDFCVQNIFCCWNMSGVVPSVWATVTSEWEIRQLCRGFKNYLAWRAERQVQYSDRENCWTTQPETAKRSVLRFSDLADKFLLDEPSSTRLSLKSSNTRNSVQRGVPKMLSYHHKGRSVQRTSAFFLIAMGTKYVYSKTSKAYASNLV